MNLSIILRTFNQWFRKVAVVKINTTGIMTTRKKSGYLPAEHQKVERIFLMLNHLKITIHHRCSHHLPSSLSRSHLKVVMKALVNVVINVNVKLALSTMTLKFMTIIRKQSCNKIGNIETTIENAVISNCNRSHRKTAPSQLARRIHDDTPGIKKNLSWKSEEILSLLTHNPEAFDITLLQGYHTMFQTHSSAKQILSRDWKVFFSIGHDMSTSNYGESSSATAGTELCVCSILFRVT